MAEEREVKLVLSAEDTTLSSSIDAANDELADLADNAVKSAKSASKGMSDAFKSIETSSQKTTDKVDKENKDLEKSFKNLGIQSDESIDKAKRKIIDDFQKIKKSGKASSQDIAKAYQAMDKELKKLDGIEDLNEDIDKTNENVNSLSDSFEKLKRIAAFGGIAAGAVTAGKALIQTTLEVSNQADELKSLSERTGFTTRQIQGLSFAAQQNSVEVDDMRDALVDFTFELGDAQKAGGDSEKRFTDLGVAIRDAGGQVRDVKDVFPEIVDAISKIANPAERAVRMAQLMGEDNQKLIPIFAQGAQGIEAYTRELDLMGGVIQDDVIGNLASMGGELSKLDVGLQAAKVSVVEAFGEDATNLLLDWAEGVTQLTKKDKELIKIEADLRKSEIELQAAQKDLSAFMSGTTEEVKKNEEQLKKEAEQLKKTTDETRKYNEELDKLRQVASEDLSLQGLSDTEKELKILQNEMDRVIEQYGVELPEALAVLEGKQRKVLQDQTKNQKAFNDELQNQIDALKIADASGPVGRAELERGIKERELDTELKALRERAKAEGLSDEKISELETLKRAELEDSLRELGDSTDSARESVNRTSDSMRDYSDSARDAGDKTKDLGDRIREVGESSTRAAGGLADALVGLDAIGAATLERTGFARSTGATGRGGAGLANDSESLTRVIDTERFFVIQEMLDKVSRGIVEASDAQIDRWRAEAERINTQRGLGVSLGSGRGAGAIVGERTVNININNDGSLDNLALESQQQLAQQIAQEINNNQNSLTGSA